MPYLFYIFFGLAPSVVWLLFYLRRDSHPESNWMILKIFFYGMLAALPAVFIEFGLKPSSGTLVLGGLANSMGLTVILNQLSYLLYIFLGVAFVEEILKYLVVQGKVLNNSELDEPLDVALYMIIAALGFAASENILLFINLGKASSFPETFTMGVLSVYRFATATFLHALSSGVVGYFLALSFFEAKNRFKLVATGLATATVLHGLYNFSIMTLREEVRLIIPIIVLIGLAIFLARGFKKLKKLKSICKT